MAYAVAISYCYRKLNRFVTHIFQVLEAGIDTAEKMQRSRQNFLSFMSHELRNPLVRSAVHIGLLPPSRFYFV